MSPWSGWMLFLVVAGAGGLGAGLRYAIDAIVKRGRRGAFPLGILIVNVTGSLALGVLTGLGSEIEGGWATAIGVGLLGGYTTFSAFSLDAALLWERGAAAEAAAYVLGSVVLALAGLFAGLWLVRTFS